MPGKYSSLRVGWLTLCVFAGLAVYILVEAKVKAQDKTRLDETVVSQKVEALLKGHGEGVVGSVWLGGDSGKAWFERNSDPPYATASAIKTFYLVELFASHRGRLDKPLPGADAVLKDDGHPAISHFSPEQRDEIRRALRGSSVRRVGEVMMGKVQASNAVYNAAANLTTATLGGPEALTRLIRDRDPAFEGVSVRRYMLRDRNEHGDNEAPATAFAALYQRLASRRFTTIDGKTIDAVREAMIERKDKSLGTSFTKDGNVDSDPLAEVRAGWWETAKGRLVYVVMTVQPTPGPIGRASSSQQLRSMANSLTDTLVRAGWTSMR